MVGVFTRIARGVSGDHHNHFPQGTETKAHTVLAVTLKDAIGAARLDLGVMEEFAPVEHPLEPPDHDKPVRCPPPEPCIVHDGRIWKERAARRRAEYPIARETSLPTSYQRRQKLEHSNFLLPSFSAPEKHLLKMIEHAAAAKPSAAKSPATTTATAAAPDNDLQRKIEEPVG
ncbi:hypothetical protein SELMODRAFT_272325 [Selaginella moellendorffii]|uniref:Uncharacterized protein n=1 Tax=Selaginella moellendorffii TaxID=88036 RepID=D8TCR0_SELML|nr:hypothetical protein SELMODRAFT_272325 [Selaginella moellendorffii]